MLNDGAVTLSTAIARSKSVGLSLSPSLIARADGVDPNDPHGRIMATLFANSGLQYEVTIRARFGSTVCALVSQGLGIAIIDEFTLAAGQWPKTRALDIVELTVFQTFIAYRKDNAPSSYGARFVAALRHRMAGIPVASAPSRGMARAR